ncbi:clan AA aspartic protease [Candidatus Poribacteria bacterium]|nr:clan AA aspartic protease [Candidatus Poribacteria bacterium]
MITGNVTVQREAIISLEVVGSDQQIQRVEAVIDTGFNGYLTLPRNLINRLKLQLVGHRRATLGDGNIVVLDVYFTTVLWHTRAQEVLVLQADGGPLVGMSLLYGNRVTLDVVDDGDVIIDTLS